MIWYHWKILQILIALLNIKKICSISNKEPACTVLPDIKIVEFGILDSHNNEDVNIIASNTSNVSSVEIISTSSDVSSVEIISNTSDVFAVEIVSDASEVSAKKNSCSDQINENVTGENSSKANSNNMNMTEENSSKSGKKSVRKSQRQLKLVEIDKASDASCIKTLIPGETDSSDLERTSKIREEMNCDHLQESSEIVEKIKVPELVTKSSDKSKTNSSDSERNIKKFNEGFSKNYSAEKLDSDLELENNNEINKYSSEPTSYSLPIFALKENSQKNNILKDSVDLEVAETPLEILHNSLDDLPTDSSIEKKVSVLKLNENTISDEKKKVDSVQNTVLNKDCADIFKEAYDNSNSSLPNFLDTQLSIEINLRERCKNQDVVSPDNSQEHFFSDESNSKGVCSGTFEITKVVEAILNESISKLSDEENEATSDKKISESFVNNQDIKLIVNGIVNQIDSGILNNSSKDKNFISVLTVLDEDQKNSMTCGSEEIENTDLNPLPDEFTAEFPFLPVPKKKRDSLIGVNLEPISSLDEKSSSKKRKGKCPKRSILGSHEQSNVIVSESDFSPKSNFQNSSKLTISKLGKRSMKRDPSSISKKKDTLSINNIEIEILEHIPCAKKPKRSLISSHVLGKTGLEMTKNESSQPLKKVKDLRNDDLTELNTRLNASSGTETRRFKMMAASQQSFEVKQNSLECNGSEEFESNHDGGKSSSILKKRKAPTDTTPVKLRKVTFADPLVKEKLFKIDDFICTQSLNKDIKGPDNEMNSSSNPIVVLTPISNDHILSLDENQNSEDLATFSDNPVSPALVNNQDSVNLLLKDLTSPAWTRALETLLLSNGIKTIGDLCRLNFQKLKMLPFKSPKLQTLHNALVSYLISTQKAIEDKFVKNEDNFSETNSNTEETNSLSTSDICNTNDVTMEENGSTIIEGMARELLLKDNIKYIEKKTLVTLAKKCFDEIVTKLD